MLNHKERADEALAEVRSVIATLQNLSSDSCLLLSRELERIQETGRMEVGTSGLAVMDGVRRCLRELFAWVPYANHELPGHCKRCGVGPDGKRSWPYDGVSANEAASDLDRHFGRLDGGDGWSPREQDLS